MKIAYSRPDGGVFIFEPAPKEALERALGPLTDEAYEAHWMERGIPKEAVDIVRLPDDWVAPDRAQRSAWRLVNGEVVIDKAAIGIASQI
jgi:hypothetical protein